MQDVLAKKRILKFTIDSDNEAVFLRIQDSGKGIPKENIKKIFSHGYTTKEDGQGFGLHGSANYMTEMGGTMWAESEGEGKGAVFVLRFPGGWRKAEGV